MSMILPWHTSAWNVLKTLRTGQRLPHALLMSGPPGVGKTQFAEVFVQSLLCNNPHDDGFCGECRACTQFRSGSYPDFKLICPEGSELDGFAVYTEAAKVPKKTVSIKQVQEITQFLAHTSNYGGYQIVLISLAEQMTPAAANALLKILEEPPGSALFVLLTQSSAALLPTIRSRCQLVKFSTPSEQQSRGWLMERIDDGKQVSALLALSNNAPLRALSWAETDAVDIAVNVAQQLMTLLSNQQDPLEMALVWDGDDVETRLEFWQMWLLDVIKGRLGCRVTSPFGHTGEGSHNTLAECPPTRLFKVLDRIAEVKHMLNAQVNRRLALEGLLIDWANIGDAKLHGSGHKSN